MGGRTSRILLKRRPDDPTRAGLGGRESRVRVGLRFSQAEVVPGDLVGLHLHGEVADFGKEVLLFGAVFGLGIARMRAESLSALRDKVVHPLLDFRDGEVVGSGEFSGGGFAFDDVHDRRGLAASGPSFDVVVGITHGVPPFPMRWRK